MIKSTALAGVTIFLIVLGKEVKFLSEVSETFFCNKRQRLSTEVLGILFF